MYRRLAATAAIGIALAMAVLPSALRADDRCAVPLADWQPREALIAALEGMGWTVLRVRADDGCYKVTATDRDGRPVKARFDPATLQRLEGDGHGRSHQDHGHDDEQD